MRTLGCELKDWRAGFDSTTFQIRGMSRRMLNFG